MIKRYDMNIIAREMDEDPEGTWVRYEDIKHLIPDPNVKDWRNEIGNWPLTPEEELEMELERRAREPHKD